MFEVNRPALDYLTVTTYSPAPMLAMYSWHESVNETGRESHVMQYAGDLRSDRYGTSFLGTATQRDMTHSMLRVSGMLSQSAFNAIKAFILTGSVNVTRIDLQVTVEYNRFDWSQVDLADALREMSPNRSVSYIESRSGPQQTKLATVYYGSRKSDRLTRIYEKMGMGDEVLLRFEAECKGRRAIVTAKHLAMGDTVKAVLWAEVLRIPDAYNLRRLLSKCLETTPKYIRVVDEPGGTGKWLREVVLSSLDRYLNQHDEESSEMAHLFYRVIKEHLTNGLESGKLG